MSAESNVYRAGDVLFSEGSEAKSLFLIQSGHVSIRKTVDGGFIEIAQAGPNQIIGELGFFDGRPRSADAVALTYCEAVLIPYEALKPIFDPAPVYLKKIMIGLATRLRDADEVIRDMKERLGENDIPISRKGENEIEEKDDDSETKKILKMTE